MNLIKNTLKVYVPILRNKKIIRIILISFVISLFLVSLIFYFLWNLAPSFSWITFIIGKFYYELVSMFWRFVVFSFLIFLIPPLFSITISFFLDSIIDATYSCVSKNRSLELKSLSYLSGFIVSIKIFFYTGMIFFVVIFLKLFFISNNFTVLSIQFLLSSYIICKEYANLICYKLSIRNPSLLKNVKNGIIGNVFFSLPIINIIAPLITAIIITTEYVREKDL